MVEQPEEITNADLLEAFTGFRAEVLERLDLINERMHDMQLSMNDIGKRLRALELTNEALLELANTSSNRLDRANQRLDRIDRKLDQVPV